MYSQCMMHGQRKDHNADDDETSESSGSCDDNIDIQRVGPLFSDRE